MLIRRIATIALILSTAYSGRSQNLRPDIGICGDMREDSLFSASGYSVLVESIGKLISPRTVSEQQFADNVKMFDGLKTKLYAFNIFLPGDLKLVGPDVNEDSVLAYAKIVFERCQRAQVHLIIWGSAGARRIPEGFDPLRAKNQFIAIARRLAAMATNYDITLALENLNTQETNFITTLQDAYEIVKEVDHPHLRLCADIYHMLIEHESPAIIARTKEYLVHCDIAEEHQRGAPGSHREDFTPYLKELKHIDYRGKIMIEARWINLQLQARPAREYLEAQLDIVYNE
jgi:sugar phosphate isomerase/epimerase